MLRFIDLSGQIDDGICFAFFNTTLDRFVYFDGSCTWHSLSDFINDFNADLPVINGMIGRTIERYVSLIPDNFFNRENRPADLDIKDWHAPLPHTSIECRPIKIAVDPALSDGDMTGKAFYRDGKLVYFSVSNIKPTKSK